MENQITVGTKVQCTKKVEFVYGEDHNVGDIITVTEETIAYYQLFVGKYYKIVENQ